MKEVVYVYSIGFCSQVAAIYVEGNLVCNEVIGFEKELLKALGYNSIPTIRVDIGWIEDLGWNFPKKIADVVFDEQQEGSVK